jgi:hypothetical protein
LKLRVRPTSARHKNSTLYGEDLDKSECEHQEILILRTPPSAFGVVVGKLTKKNTCQGPRDSNTVNQTHRMKGYRRGFSKSSFLLDRPAECSFEIYPVYLCYCVAILSMVLGRCIYREPWTVFFTPRGSLVSSVAGSKLSLTTFMRPKVLSLPTHAQYSLYASPLW